MDQVVRAHLAKLLTKGEAHMSFSEAVANFPEEHINTRPTNVDYTFWHLVEHLRLTQKDILDFMVDPHYHEPEWPKDYWPAKTATATLDQWHQSIADFSSDLAALVKLVNDPAIDLSARVPNGDSQTFLREFLLVADHNAYHVGELAILRQVVKAWPPGHQ